jgi:hypothetical protein
MVMLDFTGYLLPVLIVVAGLTVLYIIRTIISIISGG